MPTKPWYLSKTIWAGVISALIALYQAFSTAFKLPQLPLDTITAVLAALGIFVTWARTTTNTTVTK